jgi:hypothetical protein
MRAFFALPTSSSPSNRRFRQYAQNSVSLHSFDASQRALAEANSDQPRRTELPRTADNLELLRLDNVAVSCFKKWGYLPEIAYFTTARARRIRRACEATHFGHAHARSLIQGGGWSIDNYRWHE